jgi:uncharacterized membrane protein YedE/YeeE
MLVMGGAVVVTLLAYKLAPRLLARPLLGGSFHAHPSAWNRDTAVGAALFGVGWGLCGVCPGPAIAGLGTGNWTLLWALGGIALGALVQGCAPGSPAPADGLLGFLQARSAIMRSRITNFCTLPVMVMGMSSTKRM